MKLIMVILILATILIAGCTQNQPQSNSITQTSENVSKTVSQTTSSSNVKIVNASIYTSGPLPPGSLNLIVHNGESGPITLKYANATINGADVGWGFLNGYDFTTTGDFKIDSETSDINMLLKAIVTSGKWTAPSSYPISFTIYYMYNGQMMSSNGEISNS